MGLPNFLRGKVVSPVEHTVTGYRMATPGGTVEVCLHYFSVTKVVEVKARTTYERRVTGPGKGMVRRVTVPASRYFERSCPDCPARAVAADLLSFATHRVGLDPWMFVRSADGSTRTEGQT
jgi:hypothetical protein